MRPAHLRVAIALSTPAQQEIRRLLERAAQADGVLPVSEQTLMSLASQRGNHVVVDGPDGIVGYGMLDESGTAELVVDPARRRRGIGRLLAGELARLSPLPLQVWAHGDLPPARSFAAAMGWLRHRELLRMSRRLADEAPLSHVLAQLRAHRGLERLQIRPFDPATDGPAWLAVNRAAFADHPEQGRWQARDLADRVHAEWFDPAWFYLAWLDGELIGFCWLKVPAGDGSDPRAGELYVVGLVPQWQGHGLGSGLTRWAISALAAGGLERIMLYVDGDNTAARAAYEHAGFEIAARDCQYGPAQELT